MNLAEKGVHPDNLKLIDYLKVTKQVQSQEVEQVMKSIDRGDFTPFSPYQDSPQSIGYSATISAPHMHAYCLEILKDHLIGAKKVLDVGSGSGYLTLAFGKMVAETGLVYGVEHIPQLVKDSIDNISKNHKAYLDNQQIIIKASDGRMGLPEYAPYDCIHVGAAADKIPQALVDQLKAGGRMVIPVGPPGNQDIVIVDKGQDGSIKIFKTLSVSYVPLTSKESQWDGRK